VCLIDAGLKNYFLKIRWIKTVGAYAIGIGQLGLVRLGGQVRISTWQHRNIYRLDKLLAARREEVGKSKFFFLPPYLYHRRALNSVFFHFGAINLVPNQDK